MRKTLVLVMILALVVVGCASRPSGKQFRQLVYSYTGGIAGFNRSLSVQASGSFTVTEQGKADRQGRLTSAELADLRQLVGAVTWADVEAQYIDPRVADAIMQGLTVELGNSQYVTVVGTGGQPPAALDQLVGKLGQMLDKYR